MKTLLVLLTLLSSMTLMAAGTDNRAQIDFNSQGFYVTAPAAATQFQVRLMSPQRQLIYQQQSAGDALSWQQDGYQADGEYRYEAVTVTDNNGQPKQHVLSGGFEIKDGVLIYPCYTDTS